MHSTLTVTAKGQVTLRKEVLRHLGLAPGDKITVDLLADGRAEVRAARNATSIESFLACLKRPDSPPLSIAEINQIVADGWAGRR